MGTLAGFSQSRNVAPQLYCDEGTFENTLNDLDHGGYVPWELRYIDVQDSQDSVNPRKDVRILARGKWVSEQLPK